MCKKAFLRSEKFSFFVVAACVGFNDVLDAHRGSGKHGNKRKQHEEQILPQLPLARPETSVLLEKNYFNESRHEKSQTAEENCTDQADEGFEVGNGDGQTAHDNHDKSSDADFRNVSCLRNFVLNFLHQNFHRNVKLKTEGEENGKPNEHLTGDCGPFISGKIQSDAAADCVAEANVAEETHGRVKNGDGNHRDEKNAGFSEKFLGFLHRVFDGHNSTDTFHGEDDSAVE